MHVWRTMARDITGSSGFAQAWHGMDKVLRKGDLALARDQRFPSCSNPEIGGQRGEGQTKGKTGVTPTKALGNIRRC